MAVMEKYLRNIEMKSKQNYKAENNCTYCCYP